MFPPKVDVRRSADKEVKKVEEVKRFERSRSIDTRKERSPKVEEEVEATRKVIKKKEEDEEVEQQRRPVISSPHSGFPIGFFLHKMFLMELQLLRSMYNIVLFSMCKLCTNV